MKSYCIALGSISSLLGLTMMEDNIRKGMYTYVWVYIYVLVTLLYSRNCHNLVNQLHFNKKNQLKVKRAALGVPGSLVVKAQVLL